jgi:hypothetical protein
MLGRTQPLPGVAPDQITASPDFGDTLDEVGLFHFLPTGALIVGIGERAQPSGVGLEKVDLFQVTPPAGAGSPTILNLTLSSGSASPPFTNAPTIEAQRITLLPDESAVLLYDDSGSSGPLLAAVPGQAGPITVLSNLKSLDLLEIVGRRILIAARTANGAQDEQLYRGPTSLGSPPVLIASHPAGTQYLHPTPRRDGWTSFVTADLSGQVLSRVQLLNGVLQVYPGAPTVFGTSFGHSALGSLVFSLGSSGSPAAFLTWPLGGGPSVMLQAPNAPGFVLPGI